MGYRHYGEFTLDKVMMYRIVLYLFLILFDRFCYSNYFRVLLKRIRTFTPKSGWYGDLAVLQ